MHVSHPTVAVGQKMNELNELIELLIEENRKLAKHKETNILSGTMKPFSAVYGEAIAPFKLKTFVERYDTTFNVYWQQLEDAAEYRVEIYKHVSGIWYKLTELALDRNTGYASLTDLVGDGYVFRVVAEDRSGTILSRSSGMMIGYDKAE